MESNFSVDRAHDYLFIAFVVQKLNGTLDKDGAAHLNNLLQQRADLTKEQAFAFIKDAISSNLIYVEKEGDSRKLRVNQTTFNVLRDKYGDLIPQIHSNIESSKWKFRSAIRFQLSDDERQSLNKDFFLVFMERARKFKCVWHILFVCFTFYYLNRKRKVRCIDTHLC
jgi:hypothetical protein